MEAVKVIENFISENERVILNKWTLGNYKSHYFTDPGMDPFKSRTRLTTRISPKMVEFINYHIPYPKEPHIIKNRIEKKLGIENYPHPNQFYDGIVNGIGFEDGMICNHTDPVYYPNTYTLHCNLITQKPKGGGVTIINGRQYEVKERDLLCYIVSHQNHEVTPIIGKRERILWCFGFCIDEKKMNRIFKRFSLF